MISLVCNSLVLVSTQDLDGFSTKVSLTHKRMHNRFCKTSTKVSTDATVPRLYSGASTGKLGVCVTKQILRQNEHQPVTSLSPLFQFLIHLKRAKCLDMSVYNV